MIKQSQSAISQYTAMATFDDGRVEDVSGLVVVQRSQKQRSARSSSAS